MNPAFEESRVLLAFELAGESVCFRLFHEIILVMCVIAWTSFVRMSTRAAVRLKLLWSCCPTDMKK